MEPADDYAALDEESQVEALRPAALAAAADFGLDVHRMEVVLHAYNTTFRVDTTDGRRVALRVGTNSKSTPGNVIAQQAWQAAIATDTDVLVPRPLRTRAGDWSTTGAVVGVDHPVLVTAASWLEGEDAREDDGADWARALGRATATLHEHAAGWTMPAGAALPRFTDPLFGDTDVLDTAPGLTAPDRAVLDEARRVAAEVFDRMRDRPAIPLHADLHGGNLKWHEGRLAVFDFDDAGTAPRVLDLAITTFYLRRGAGAETAEEALLAGYAEVAPLPDVPRGDVEALVASRQLLLANALLDSTTASLRAMAAEYALTTVRRLRHWLDTGTFRLDVEG
ncbi:phosphotransferase [Phycicoccus sp. HDW14]|uniref:phosphotransferase enzyme family protein n=1 Tax=Phycicoccus sp. HDW14 TaxID=2714941 RepID=UPI001407C1FD|nr:phosphotransferase [Phycicoccus sp. HDW14]QIM20792.1 phosphotransferase [Phycicoccus sp. HDW14]